ncbi:MAG: glycosyltransferase family 39 protein [Patescibacteria group bacterium]
MKRNLLIIVLLVATVLRFGGVYPGYSRFHSDEPIIYGTAVDMIRNKNLNPGRYDYPGPAIYLNYIAYRVFFIPVSWLKFYVINIDKIVDGIIKLPLSFHDKKRIFQVEILGNREVNAMYWGRYLTAAFGVGNVVLIYVLGKKLFNRNVGLIAALLLTFDFRHVTNSHIGLPDIYNSFFLLLSLIATVSLWKQESRKNYLLAGLAMGAAFATKYQVFSIFPFALVHLLLAFKSGKFSLKKLFRLEAFMAGFVALLVIFLTNPYFFIEIEKAVGWTVDVSRKYAMGISRVNLFPLSYLYNYDFGPILFVVTIVGIVFMFLKGLINKSVLAKATFLSLVLIPYFFIFAYYSNGGFYVRNLITITPVLIIFASYLLYSIANFSKWLFFPLLLLCLFVPAKNSLIHTYYNTKQWNYQLTSDWLYKNWDVSRVVASHPFDPPTGSPEMVKTEFELDGAYSIAEHKENGAEYALINFDWAGNPFYDWMSFDFSKPELFFSKPWDQLRNSYHGIAAEEIVRYQIFAATKPWQAPDANLIMAKLPQWPKTQMVSIGTFDGQNLPQNFKVKPGHLYKVVATIETTTQLSSKKRNGYIKVEFANSNTKTVSARVYGAPGIYSKEVVERAPDNSESMAIAFVANESSLVTLKQIEIWESVDRVEDIGKNPPYKYQQIDLDTLYPNSHGNL